MVSNRQLAVSKCTAQKTFCSKFMQKFARTRVTSKVDRHHDWGPNGAWGRADPGLKFYPGIVKPQPAFRSILTVARTTTI